MYIKVQLDTCYQYSDYDLFNPVNIITGSIDVLLPFNFDLRIDLKVMQ